MPILREGGPEITVDLLNDHNFNPKGIMLIGANHGYEYLVYKETSAVNVIYVEPIPEIYEACKRRIRNIPGHVAVRAVCSDTSGKPVSFNVASNGGESSSMLPLGEVEKLHPEISYTHTLEMITTTGDNIVKKLGLNTLEIDYLILDVQGSELTVLKGCTEILKHVKFLVCEVSDYPLYEGGCTLSELNQFILPLGFEIEREWLRGKPGRRVGDVVYQRK